MPEAINSQNRLMEIVLSDGVTKPVPSSTLINPIKITVSSDIKLDQSPMNSQSDIATGTMSPVPDLPSVLGGTATFEFNLKSTDQLTDPNVKNLIETCRFTMVEEQLLVLSADAVNAVEGDELTGATSNAVGTCIMIDGAKIVVRKDSGSADFELSENIMNDTDVVGAVSNIDYLGYYVHPDSTNKTKASVFLYIDGVRKALYECAGTMSMTMESGGLIKVTGTLLGKKDSENWGDVTMPNAVFSANDSITFKGSQLSLEENGVPVTEMVNKSCEISLGSVTSLRPNSIADEGLVGGEVDSRADAMATVVNEMKKLGDFDPWAAKENKSIIKLSLRLGDGSIGNTCYVRANYGRMGEVAASQENNREYVTMPIKLTGTNDDEQYWVFI